MRSEVLRLWQSGEVPTRCILIITHGIEEAIQLADRLIILERDPGRIRTTIPVDLPHPRDRKSEEFEELAEAVYSALTSEDPLPQTASPKDRGRAETKGAGKESSASTEPIEEHDLSSPLVITEQQLVVDDANNDAEKYPMLPGVRIASVAGLLAFIMEEPADLYMLGQRLQLDVDDLYPIIEAAEILGLIELDGTDCAINERGRHFLTSSIDERKAIVRMAVAGPEARDNGARLVREIHHLLCQAGRSARIPQELIFDTILLKHFSPQESRRQLEIAVEWGRFAELYGYEALTGSLFLDPEDPKGHDADS